MELTDIVICICIFGFRPPGRVWCAGCGAGPLTSRPADAVQLGSVAVGMSRAMFLSATQSTHTKERRLSVKATDAVHPNKVDFGVASRRERFDFRLPRSSWALCGCVTHRNEASRDQARSADGSRGTGPHPRYFNYVLLYTLNALLKRDYCSVGSAKFVKYSGYKNIELGLCFYALMDLKKRSKVE